LNNTQDRDRAGTNASARHNNRVWPVLLIGFLLGLGWLILSLNPGSHEKSGRSSAASAANCNIQAGPCTRELSGGTVMLDIHPKPVRAMRDLRFTVKINGPRLTNNPHIDLDMPTMAMGFNRVYLEPAGPGLYAGDGVIVRCPSGVPTWQAVVVLPGFGEVEYTFDVRY